MQYYYTPIRKKTKKEKKKLRTLRANYTLLVGMQNGNCHFVFGSFLWKYIHPYLPYTPSNHTSSYLYQEVKLDLVHTKNCIIMFIVALFIIWTSRNNPNVLHPGDN